VLFSKLAVKNNIDLWNSLSETVFTIDWLSIYHLAYYTVYGSSKPLWNTFWENNEISMKSPLDRPPGDGLWHCTVLL